MARDNTTRLVLAVLVIVAAFFVSRMLFAGPGAMGGGPMMGGMWGDGAWGHSAMPGWVLLAGFVMQLLFLAVLVAAGYLIYRETTDRDVSDEALEELRLAYARGDLTDEEYQERREALERDSE